MAEGWAWLKSGWCVRKEEIGNLTIPTPRQHSLQLRCKKRLTEVLTCVPPWKGLNTHLATRRSKAPHFTDGDTETWGSDPCLPHPPGRAGPAGHSSSLGSAAAGGCSLGGGCGSGGCGVGGEREGLGGLWLRHHRRPPSLWLEGLENEADRLAKV